MVIGADEVVGETTGELDVLEQPPLHDVMVRVEVVRVVIVTTPDEWVL